jgi:hypothetical protein
MLFKHFYDTKWTIGTAPYPSRFTDFNLRLVPLQLGPPDSERSTKSTLLLILKHFQLNLTSRVHSSQLED